MISWEISFTARASPCVNYDKITGKIPCEYHVVLIKKKMKKKRDVFPIRYQKFKQVSPSRRDDQWGDP